MPQHTIPRPTQQQVLQAFALRHVRDGQAVLDKLQTLAEQHLSLAYLSSLRHTCNFYIDFRLDADELSRSDNENEILAADLSLALARWLEVKLWVPGEPEVEVAVTVSRSKRSITVSLAVNHLEAAPRAVTTGAKYSVDQTSPLAADK